jgi:hypothetical protein
MGKPTHARWIREYQNARCSLFQTDAPEQIDYPWRSDLLVGYTVVPELSRRVGAGEPVRTADLAKCGETFCYVKIDGIEGLGGSRFADREEIEVAVDEALADAGIGCVIGAGTGRRYSYVDVAVNDVARAQRIIRNVLREGNITKNCWVLPFDGDRDQEWIGIWDDTPAPPGS